MKVNTINQSIYRNANIHKVSDINSQYNNRNCQNISNDNCSTKTSFQGLKGKFKGGTYGAASALLLAVLLGQIGFALFPFLTVGGALVGHKLEEEKLGHIE